MPTYTKKTNATMDKAKVVFVADHSELKNIIDGTAITVGAGMATSVVAGKTVYGSGATAAGATLTIPGPAVTTSDKFAVMLMFHDGLTLSNDTSLISGPISCGTVVGPKLQNYYPYVGGSQSSTNLPGYTHPGTSIRTFIWGKDSQNTLTNFADGVSYPATNGAYANGISWAAANWSVGGKAGSGSTPGGAGVYAFAIFVGVGPTELAAYLGSDPVAAMLDGGAAGAAPSITTQPSNASVAAGATATFTAASSGSPTPTYQWQRNPGGVGSWADIASATAASYTTPATTVSGGSANNGDTYRVVATNASGSATSTAATLTVSASNAAPTFPGPSISNLSITQGAAMSAVNVASKFSDTDALTFSAIGTWPAGITVSSAGVISGTPTTVGNYTGLTVRATDTAAQTVDSNTFSIAVTAVTATLNFQASGMEFGARTGLGIATFALDVGSGYRYTVHADGLTLGAAIYTSGVVTTDSAGKLPNLVDASIMAGATYRVHAVRQSDGAAATFKMVAA
ncbi:MAG: hypothetical protein C0423_19855 [Methylibium sp.]|nr:hypothetical protein [Methylibium sp.]